MERMKNLTHSTYAPMERKTFITYIFHTEFSKFCKILEYKNNNYFVMDELLKFTIKRRKIDFNINTCKNSCSLPTE